MRKHLPLAVFLLMFSIVAHAQHTSLRNEINRIAAASKGKVGVAVSLLETGDTLTYHNQDKYVLHSVAKLAIAFAVLHEVDKGRFKLEQPIHITKEDLPPTYSPLRDLHPDGNVDIPLRVLINYMISLSDNNACDILLKQLGGTKLVEDLLHSVGISPIAIKASEADMAAAWPVQYNNWCQPMTQVQLLKLALTSTFLSKSSRDCLAAALLATSTGPKRIKGLMPLGTAVMHKTGTSPTNDKGLTPATNDVGIIVLPNGRHLAVAIFITDSTAPSATRDLVIAQIAKAAHDEFVRR
ncbi:class A beta-lactamase [Mucilaginibacter mali]|uniref:beta-lactamase n=2 Tax=Mucilaginibacter mali TaxID=2740462 RepID=A0A7D4UM15_9SPHI|nr:class A beta-lactamase [Mucilaginibacter mali]